MIFLIHGGPSHPQNALAAPDAAGAGAHGFQNGAAVNGVQKGVVLGLVAREFDGVALVGHVDDAAPEDVGFLKAVYFLLYLLCFYIPFQITLLEIQAIFPSIFLWIFLQILLLLIPG